MSSLLSLSSYPHLQLTSEIRAKLLFHTTFARHHLHLAPSTFLFSFNIRITSSLFNGWWASIANRLSPLIPLFLLFARTPTMVTSNIPGSCRPKRVKYADGLIVGRYKEPVCLVLWGWRGDSAVLFITPILCASIKSFILWSYLLKIIFWLC